MKDELMFPQPLERFAGNTIVELDLITQQKVI